MVHKTGVDNTLYRWRLSNNNRHEQRTLSGVEFLRLVLQHVLPKGFRQARNYELLHPNSKRLMALLRLLVNSARNGRTGLHWRSNNVLGLRVVARTT